MAKCVISGVAPGGGGVKIVTGEVAFDTKTPANVNLGAKPKIVFFRYQSECTGFVVEETDTRIMETGAFVFYARIFADGFRMSASNSIGSPSVKVEYAAIF